MKIDVTHTAKLANLPMSEKEIKKFEKQLSAVLGNIDKLSEASTDNIEETNQVTGLANITKSDEVTKSLTQKEALTNAPKTHNGSFVVPAILDEVI